MKDKGVEDPVFSQCYRIKERLGGKTLMKEINKYLKEISEENQIGRLTSHDFRRYYINTLLKGDLSLAVVSDMVGHESTKTTEIYINRIAEMEHYRRAGKLFTEIKV